MGSLNRVMLIGNLGKDVEARMTPSGVKVTSFRLATTEKYTDKNGNKVEATEWHSVVCWRGLAEVVEKYVKRGEKVYVQGRLKTRSFEDKNGQTRYVTEIIADDVLFLSQKNETKNSIKNEVSEIIDSRIPEKSKTQTLIPATEDELPF